MKYVKYLYASIDNQSRDKREIEVALDMGWDVVVFTSSYEDKENEVLRRCKVIIHEKEKAYMKIKFALLRKSITACLMFFRCLGVARQRADVISGHDIKGLKMAYYARLLSLKSSTKLVYDAHEFELGRLGHRSDAQMNKIRKLEYKLIKKSSLSIMVNNTIKEATLKEYELDEDTPVAVIRNIPSKWEVSKEVIAEKRKEITNALGVPYDTFIVMYHGGIAYERGIEQMIEVIGKNKNIVGVIMGNGNYVELNNKIEKLINELDLEKRVYRINAVKQTDIWQYAGAVNVGMVIAQPTCTNHFYMLPNKFFENIQSQTPLICSNFPVMSAMLEQYGVGVTVESSSVDDINEKIELLRTDKEFYDKLKHNTKLAKEELCWEKEKLILKDAFKKYLQD